MISTACPKPKPRIAKSPTPIARTAVKKRNAARNKRDFVKHFHSGERTAFVNSLPCVVGRECFGKPANHHVKSRGAGGTYQQTIPICAAHHLWLHEYGRRSFERYYEINLAAAAAETEKQWQSWLQRAG